MAASRKKTTSKVGDLTPEQRKWQLQRGHKDPKPDADQTLERAFEALAAQRELEGAQVAVTYPIRLERINMAKPLDPDAEGWLGIDIRGSTVVRQATRLVERIELVAPMVARITTTQGRRVWVAIDTGIEA